MGAAILDKSDNLARKIWSWEWANSKFSGGINLHHNKHWCSDFVSVLKNITIASSKLFIMSPELPTSAIVYIFALLAAIIFLRGENVQTSFLEKMVFSRFLTTFKVYFIQIIDFKPFASILKNFDRPL